MTDELEDKAVDAQAESDDHSDVEDIESSDAEQEDVQDGEGEVEAGQAAEAEAETEEDDEIIVTIGDEEPQKEEPAPQWVKELRKTNRRIEKENRELKKRVESFQNPVEAVSLGERPKIYDYEDDSEFEKALEKWIETKRKVDEQKSQAEAEKQKQQEAWQQKLNNYAQLKSSIKASDFEDAEAVVMETLNETQQGIILQGADNPAHVVYALGLHPEKSKEISSIKDPVQFAFAVAKLEKDLKVTSKRSPPPPERKVTSTAPTSGAVDSTLERLRAKAEKTGDYSEVFKYKQSKRAN